MPIQSTPAQTPDPKRGFYPDEWHKQHGIPDETTLEPHESEASVLLGLTQTQVILLLLTMIFSGFLATGVCCVNELTKLNIGIDPALIPLIGTGIPLCIGYRLTRSHSQWCKRHDAWIRMHRLSRSLARIIWTEYRPNASVESKWSRLQRSQLIGALAVIMILARNKGNPDGPSSEKIKRYLGEYVKHVCPLNITLLEPSANEGPAGVLSPKTWETQMRRRLHNVLADTIRQLVLSDQLPFEPLCKKLDHFIEASERLASHSVQVLPVSCKRIIRLSVWAFLALLPFQLIDSLHWFTIPVQFMTTAVYVVLSEIEINSEAPFKGGYDGSSLAGFVKVWEEAEVKEERTREERGRTRGGSSLHEHTGCTMDEGN